jgi:uncharacterized surface protein with fasciclin (FAS1) repeats
MDMTAWRMMATAAALGVAACNNGNEGSKPTGAGDERASASAQNELAKVLDTADELSSTAGLVRAAGLEQAFSGAGSYTLFAPTNAAISALPESERKHLESPEGRPQLIALLRQHVVPGYVSKADLDKGLSRGGSVTLASVGPAPLTLRKQDDTIALGDGLDAPRLAGQPIETRNGVIYPIDRVLPPPTAR